MGVFKTDTAIILILVLIAIMLAAVAYFLRSISCSLSALEQKIGSEKNSIVEVIKTSEPVEGSEPNEAEESYEEAVENSTEGRPVSTGLSPQLVAAITAAVAVYLDDPNMEHHMVSSVKSTP